MKRREVIRYSEAFKNEVIQEIERGRFESLEGARRRYGIGGTGTIKRWLKKFGKHQYLGKVVRVEKPQERKEVVSGDRL